jgi:titin
MGTSVNGYHLLVVDGCKAWVSLCSIDVPDKPESVEITDVQKSSVKLQWIPPTNDGGSPITGYLIEKRDMKRPTWTNAGKAPKDATEFVVDKLLEGTEYMFRVIAENKKGPSKPCETTAPVVPKSPYGRQSLYLV